MKTWRIALFLLLLTLVLIVPVYAQETTPAADATSEATVEASVSESVPPETNPVAGVAEETEDNGLAGSPLLVLLLGLGAVAVVGLGTLMRESYSPPQE